MNNVPTQAEGCMADQILQRIVDAIERAYPGQGKVEEFKDWCGYFGQCQEHEIKQKTTEFYQWMTADLGKDFTNGMLPELVRLLPDEKKRRQLLEVAGLLARSAEEDSSAESAITSAASTGGTAPENVENMSWQQLFDKATAMAAKGAEETAADIKVFAAEAQVGLAQEVEATKRMLEEQRAKEDLARKTPQYLKESQKPVSEIMGDVKAMDEIHHPFRGHDEMLHAIERCMQYAQSLCACGYGETCITGWHVTSAIDSTLGFQNKYVLVLTSAGYFRIAYDVTHQKIASYTKMAMDDVINVKDSGFGGKALTLICKKMSKTIFNMSTVRQDQQEDYFPVVAEDSEFGESAIAGDITKAFQMVHRRFVHVWDHLGDEGVEKISAESVQEAQQAISAAVPDEEASQQTTTPSEEEAEAEEEQPPVPTLTYKDRLRLREEEKKRLEEEEAEKVRKHGQETARKEAQQRAEFLARKDREAAARAVAVEKQRLKWMEKKLAKEASQAKEEADAVAVERLEQQKIVEDLAAQKAAEQQAEEEKKKQEAERRQHAEAEARAKKEKLDLKKKEIFSDLFADSEDAEEKSLFGGRKAPEGIFDDGAASSNGTKPATVAPKPRNTPPKTTVVTSEDPLETAQTSEIVDPS